MEACMAISFNLGAMLKRPRGPVRSFVDGLGQRYEHTVLLFQRVGNAPKAFGHRSQDISFLDWGMLAALADAEHCQPLLHDKIAKQLEHNVERYRQA